MIRDPIKKKAYQRAYYQATKPKRRQSESMYRLRLRLEMLWEYGHKCCHCGIEDRDVLVLDHVFNQARRDYEIHGERGGYRLWAKLKKLGWPKDSYQLLCHNCNYKKEHERRSQECTDRRILDAQQIARASQANGNGFSQPRNGQENRSASQCR